MRLDTFVAMMRSGQPLPKPQTIEQRVCTLFLKAGAEVERISLARPLSRQDLRVMTALPENTLHQAIKGLLRKQCVSHFQTRGQYIINPNGEWPEDRRGHRRQQSWSVMPSGGGW